jgi:hypothetical protein
MSNPTAKAARSQRSSAARDRPRATRDADGRAARHRACTFGIDCPIDRCSGKDYRSFLAYAPAGAIMLPPLVPRRGARRLYGVPSQSNSPRRGRARSRHRHTHKVRAGGRGQPRHDASDELRVRELHAGPHRPGASAGVSRPTPPGSHACAPAYRDGLRCSGAAWTGCAASTLCSMQRTRMVQTPAWDATCHAHA